MPFRCCIAAGLSRPWRADRRARRRCSCKARWCSRSQNWCRWSARLSVLRQSVPRCRFLRQGTAEPGRSVLRRRIFWTVAAVSSVCFSCAGLTPESFAPAAAFTAVVLVSSVMFMVKLLFRGNADLPASDSVLRRLCGSAHIMECRCSRETLNKTKSTRSNERTHGSDFVTFRFIQRIPSF